MLPTYTEEENAKNSGTYSHVEWRSIAEIIEYLGALLRTRDASAARWSSTGSSGGTISHTLFELTRDAPAGFQQVQYRGATYTVRTDADQPAEGSRNQSMQALSLLGELVGTAKVSSDIPNTQAIQIVP